MVLEILSILNQSLEIVFTVMNAFINGYMFILMISLGLAIFNLMIKYVIVRARS